MGSTFGDLFCVSTFGESHGGGVGVIIDGCPPRLQLDISKIQNELRPHLDKLMMDGSSPRIPTMEGIEDSLNLKLYDQLAGNEQKSIQSADKPETE